MTLRQQCDFSLDYNPRMATVEHELLTFFSVKGEATLREATDEFGAPRGITRGSVVKMTDRLYKKGLLKRRVGEHAFLYATSEPIEEIEAGYVDRFVGARLKGNVVPLLGFLADNSALQPAERKAIQKIAQRLEQED